MLISLLFALAFQGPGQIPTLYQFKGVSRPEWPVVSVPSENGDYILQASGTELIVLWAKGVTDCADGIGPCTVDALNHDPIQDIPLSRTVVDVSIQDIKEINGVVYIAGGDYGLVVLQPNGGNGYENGYTEVYRNTSFPAGSTTGRWCMDVSVKNSGVVAVFAGLDDSELRVYSQAVPPQLLKTFPLGALPSAGQIPSPSQSFAVEYLDGMAYVGMAQAGVYRVDTTQDPLADPSQWLTAGPLQVGVSCQTASTPEFGFVHDLDLVPASNTDTDNYLYAAADGWGLVEFDLNQTWGVNMPFWYSNPSCYWDALPPTNCNSGTGTSVYLHALEVTAVRDEDHEQVLIGVSSPTAGPSGLLAPYTPFATLGWDLQAPFTVPESDKQCAPYYQLFLRSTITGTPHEVVSLRYEIKAVPDKSVLRNWPITLLKEPGGDNFWLIDAPLRVLHYQRVGLPLTLAGFNPDGIYPPQSSPLGAIGALNDPNLLLPGHDTEDNSAPYIGLYRVVPTGGVPVFEQISPLPTAPDRLNLKLFGSAQWIDSTPGQSNFEFLMRGKGVQVPPDPEGKNSNLYRFDASSNATILALKRNSVFWENDPLAPPAPPVVWTFPEGRGYSYTARDWRPGSRLVAETRGGILSGAWLFDTVELQGLAWPNAPDGADIKPTLFTALVTHTSQEVDPNDPNMSTSFYEERIYPAKSMEPLFFDLTDSTGFTSRVLGVAAGYSLEDPVAPNTTYGRPQLTFYDVSSFLTPPAAGPAPIVVRSATSIPKATTLCLDAQVVMMIDPAQPSTKTPHTLVFCGGTMGFLSVFDVTNLLTTGIAAEVSNDLPVNVFDGTGDVVTKVDFIPSVGGNRLGYLHVAAIRLGMTRYTVRDAGNGSVTLTRSGGFNTPGTMSDFQILTVNGKERLMIADHHYYGIRAYGSF